VAVSTEHDQRLSANPKHDVPVYFVLFGGHKPARSYRLTINVEDFVAVYLKGEGTLHYMFDRNLAPHDLVVDLDCAPTSQDA